MILRQRQSHLFGKRTAGREPPPRGALEVLTDQTVPGIPPPRPVAAEQPTILGFPAEVESADDDRSSVLDTWGEPPPPPPVSAAELPVRLVTLPRADPLAGIALVLAGAAAAASLWLPWVRGVPDTGSSLVFRGLRAAGASTGDVSRSGLWQPPVIVLGGGLLLLLGVLLFLPARTHRVAGVAALLLASAAAAGVLFQVSRLDWDTARFDAGMWCAVAVPALALLGALKAMLTPPSITLRHRRADRR
jgi:hypothetical protein